MAQVLLYCNPPTAENQGILSTHLHSDGESAELLAMFNPGTHANHWTPEPVADFNDGEIADMFMSHAMVDKAQNFPNMDGPAVFKKAVVKFPEVIMEALTTNGLQPSDITSTDPSPGQFAYCTICTTKTQVER